MIVMKQTDLSGNLGPRGAFASSVIHRPSALPSSEMIARGMHAYEISRITLQHLADSRDGYQRGEPTEVSEITGRSSSCRAGDKFLIANRKRISRDRASTFSAFVRR